jgi:hypothetical protein
VTLILAIRLAYKNLLQCLFEQLSLLGSEPLLMVRLRTTNGDSQEAVEGTFCAMEHEAFDHERASPRVVAVASGWMCRSDADKRDYLAFAIRARPRLPQEEHNPSTFFFGASSRYPDAHSAHPTSDLGAVVITSWML